MIRFSVRAILLDVEGTMSSISFVYDKMFPYARRTLREYLGAQIDHADLGEVHNDLDEALRLLAVDAGFPTAKDWYQSQLDLTPSELVARFVESLMDSDSKATGLKSLQGLLWKSGFEMGELQSHLFEDVAPSLRRWHELGKRLAIYSSGSVTAQKLFFGHTVEGDLNSLISANFDTNTGSKRNKESYQKIADQLKLQTCDVLFLSDIADELAAAHAIGMQVAVVARPGNAEIPQWYFGPVVKSFREISIL